MRNAWSSFTHTTLGNTGLKICRLGVASSYGIGARSLEWAFDQGINYFYWGSLRRRGMRDAIRHIARRERERLVVVIQSYTRLPYLLQRNVAQALCDLKIDFADVLLLGWWNGMPPHWLRAEAEKLKEEGKVRYVGLSTHNRKFARKFVKKHSFELLHLRYNAAHRGAETEVFPYIHRSSPPIVTYTTTRWGTLLKKPKQASFDLPVPTSTDCYRFALTHSAVSAVMCGPANRKEIKLALLALKKGPLTEEELTCMRAFGDRVHQEKARPSLWRNIALLFDEKE